MERAEGFGQQKKRMANLEALRLLAMMMVVSLHYLGKGKLLPDLTGHLLATGHLAWLLESFSIAAVDVYLLLSGYFLVETGFRCKRIISLVLQVLFYTCLLPVILIGIGVLPQGEITFYNILQCVFPVNMMHYWFVSAYVLLFLFTPILNAAVRSFQKKQLQAVILLLLIMESLSKTVLPVRLELDNLGYDAYWFMVVYLIAAYIRLYGISFLEKREKKAGRAVFCYVAACIAIYALTMLIRGAYLATGQLEHFIKSAYGYNHLLAIGAAVSLFYIFLNWEFGKWETALSAAICKLAPCSFGVYLLHEQVNLRDRWPIWLGADKCDSALSLLGYWLTAILTVMVIGLIADYGRSLLFRRIGKLPVISRLEETLKKVDNKINGVAE